MTTPHARKVYLGDGAYIQWDGNGCQLTAENGVVATDAVYLEQEVISELLKYFKAQFPDAAIWKDRT